jgi:hypothetical protein
MCLQWFTFSASQFQAIVSGSLKQIREVSIKIKGHFPHLHRLNANDMLVVRSKLGTDQYKFSPAR